MLANLRVKVNNPQVWLVMARYCYENVAASRKAKEDYQSARVARDDVRKKKTQINC